MRLSGKRAPLISNGQCAISGHHREHLANTSPITGRLCLARNSGEGYTTFGGIWIVKVSQRCEKCRIYIYIAARNKSRASGPLFSCLQYNATGPSGKTDAIIYEEKALR